MFAAACNEPKNPASEEKSDPLPPAEALVAMKGMAVAAQKQTCASRDSSMGMCSPISGTR